MVWSRSRAGAGPSLVGAVDVTEALQGGQGLAEAVVVDGQEPSQLGAPDGGRSTSQRGQDTVLQVRGRVVVRLDEGRMRRVEGEVEVARRR